MSETRAPYLNTPPPENYLAYGDFEQPLFNALFRASFGISTRADADLLADEIRRLRRELSREQGNT